MAKAPFFIFIAFILIVGCKNEDQAETSQDPTIENINLSQYKIEDIRGSEIKSLTKFNAQGLLEEQGMSINGQKTGTWVKYYAKQGKIMEVWNYAAGRLNGVHMLLNNSGRVDMYESFLNGKLHGTRMTFKLGTPVEMLTYSIGILDGPYRGFAPSGKLIKQVNYLNGVMDGRYLQTDDNGKVLFDCIYAKGVKVSCK